jgi:hypothetical protein
MRLLSDPKVAQQACQIIEGVMRACSPRLSDIVASMPWSESVSYKRTQRFQLDKEPCETLKLMFDEEADFVMDKAIRNVHCPDRAGSGQLANFPGAQ